MGKDTRGDEQRPDSLVKARLPLQQGTETYLERGRKSNSKGNKNMPLKAKGFRADLRVVSWALNR